MATSKDIPVRPMTLPEVVDSPRFDEILAAEREGAWTADDSPLTFRDFSEQALHVDLSTPRVGVGDPAPAIELPRLEPGEDEGKMIGEVVRVSEYAGEKPVVLVFGSYTCPPLRASMGLVERLRERLGDRVAFFIVYSKEVHPEEGWVLKANRAMGIVVNDPDQLQERAALATTMVRELGLATPILIDGLDNGVTRAYGAFPIRLYLIGVDGRIAYQGALGPFEFHPPELAMAIERELAESRP